MIYILPIIALLSLVFGTPTHQLSRRINKGYTAVKFEFPFMVGISKGNYINCGGTLYKENVIITAGHCISERKSIYYAHIHRHDKSKKPNEENEEKYPIIKSRSIYGTKSYYSRTAIITDIGVGLINRPSGNPSPIILDTEFTGLKSGFELKAIGWGSADSNLKATLQVADQIVYNLDWCKLKNSVFNTRLTFCLGSLKDESGVRYGDSGGPNFYKNSQGQFVLVGLNSYGNFFNRAGPMAPTYSTQITPFINWINTTINNFENSDVYNSPREAESPMTEQESNLISEGLYGNELHKSGGNWRTDSRLVNPEFAPEEIEASKVAVENEKFIKPIFISHP